MTELTTFALFGGFGEFDDWAVPVHQSLFDACVGDGSVCVLPMAYDDEAFIRAQELPLYERIGAHPLLLPIRSRADAQASSNAEAIANCSVIFLHGGMPQWLVDTLAETLVWNAIKEAVARGASLAGTSGGVICLGREVFRFGDNPTEVGWTPGLDLLPGGVLGAHWDNNQYEWLRAPFGLLPAETLVIAVDERTAAVGDGTTWTAVGHGAVHVRRDGDEHQRRAAETFDADLTGRSGGANRFADGRRVGVHAQAA